jgi:exodeoxyribonuclease-5
MDEKTRGSGDALVRNAHSALSEDQAKAAHDIAAAVDSGQLASVLVGPAGSGKTTLMQHVMDQFAQKRGCVLLAPTGKAASVLQSKTGRMASTIHKALFGGVDEDGEELVFKEPGPPCLAGDLVVVDEASMVGESLHRTLVEQLPKGAQLLYVGDKEQLPPVNEAWGPNFDSPDAELTQVHRQAEKSPILRLATAIRTRRGFTGWTDGACERGTGRPVQWLAERAKGDATLLAYTNKTRRELNAKVREALGLHKSIPCIGDRVVCLLNSTALGIMNGEVATIDSVRPSAWASQRYGGDVWVAELSTGQTARFNTDLLGASAGAFKRWRDRVKARKGDVDNLLHIDFGWCLTVHKSQGSEWQSVGFVADGGYQWLKRKNPDDARRLAYTAVTRARSELRIFS